MDRMIHTALNSIKNIYDTRSKISNNLANMTVPGFRRDMPNEGGTFNLNLDGTPSARSFALEEGAAAFSRRQGTVSQTDWMWDVAILGDGYFFVDPGDGNIALNRRGDFSVSGNGFLVNGAQERVLGPDLAPIEVPQHTEVQITPTGEILVHPLGADPNVFEQVGVLGTTLGVGEELQKGIDTRIRRPDGTVPAADQGARMAQAMLEASNVNSVEELISSMEIQRQFEISIKLISLAEDIDRAGAEVMRLPEG